MLYIILLNRTKESTREERKKEKKEETKRKENTRSGNYQAVSMRKEELKVNHSWSNKTDDDGYYSIT